MISFAAVAIAIMPDEHCRAIDIELWVDQLVESEGATGRQCGSRFAVVGEACFDFAAGPSPEARHIDPVAHRGAVLFDEAVVKLDALAAPVADDCRIARAGD